MEWMDLWVKHKALFGANQFYWIKLIISTDQDKCQGIDTVLKDVDEVGGDDANAAQLGIDGGHEDAEHSSSVQLLQSCR